MKRNISLLPFFSLTQTRKNEVGLVGTHSRSKIRCTAFKCYKLRR